jgi:lysozyme
MDALASFIKRHEGYSDVPYRCPAGYITIGWGHVVRQGEAYEGPITHVQAEIMLAGDIALARGAVSRLIEVSLRSHEADALASFTFNLGSGALQRSTLRRKLNRGEHDAVPAELMRWVFAGGRKLTGLVRRRAEEAALFEGRYKG